MNESTFPKLENLFLALADGTRLRLLVLMAGGEVSVGFLADQLGESQPKISRHLAYLRSTGLVSTRRDGKRIFYGIEKQLNPSVAAVLNTTLSSLSERVYGGSDVKTDSYSAELNIKPYDSETDTSVDTYMNDWSPNEIEIHLL